MKLTRQDLLLWICLFGGVGVLWGTAVELLHWNHMADFRAVYSASRCLLHHRDPYIFDNLRSEYVAEGAPEPKTAKDRWVLNEGMMRCVNLPTALFLIIPLAALPWGVAHVLWALLIVSSSLVAAFVITRQAAQHAPGPAVILMGIWLLGVGDVILGGNLAGIVVNLCILGAWLLLNNKKPWVAVACLATALLLKPHDAGFVWLFFLISPSPFRKHALRALAVVMAMAAASVVWVSSIAPAWAQELSGNIHRLTGPGGFNNPAGRDVSLVINLQAALVAYKNDPHFYLPVSWIVSGCVLILLLIRIARTAYTERSAWIALASLAALTMLPVYHRYYDARLLLLSLPACTLIWRDRKWKWTLLILNMVCMMTTLLLCYAGLVSAFGDQTASLLLKQLNPISLLALGIFYLWTYWKEARRSNQADGEEVVQHGLSGMAYCETSVPNRIDG